MNVMKNKNKLLIIIFILIVIVVILMLVLKNKKQSNIVAEPEEQIEVPNALNPDELTTMGEKERVKFYFTEYINNITDNKLEDAYNMLYDEFKNTYFKSLADYKAYIDTKYPDILLVNYDEIQREGYYYIITADIIDGMTDEKFTQKFVLREYDFNNFVISFQAE